MWKGVRGAGEHRWHWMRLSPTGLVVEGHLDVTWAVAPARLPIEDAPVPEASDTLAAAIAAHFAQYPAGGRVRPMAIQWCSACAEPLEPDDGCAECGGVGWHPVHVAASDAKRAEDAA